MNKTRRIELQNGQGWLAYLKLILRHGLIFAALGPAIGALASPGVIFLPIALIAAYYVSLPAAMLAGLAVGAAALFVHSRMIYIAGTAIGALSGVLFPFAFVLAQAPPSLLVWYAIAGAVAGLVCTRATRNIRERWLPA